ncbi:hypothetical protein ES705_26501 [subsurface metagenome]
MDKSCWEWHLYPNCGGLLFGNCPDCGDLLSAVIPSDAFVGIAEMSCQRVNEVDGSVPDGCGWKCQVYIDVPKRKVYYVREVCSRGA